MTGSAKNPSMFVHFTHLHKKLTNFWFLCTISYMCTLIKLKNFLLIIFCNVTLKLCDFIILCQNLHANMEGFRWASHICSAHIPILKSTSFLVSTACETCSFSRSKFWYALWMDLRREKSHYTLITLPSSPGGDFWKPCPVNPYSWTD